MRRNYRRSRRIAAVAGVSVSSSSRCHRPGRTLTMNRMIFVNLPVADLAATKAF
jgi:hypothetical protein